MLRKAPLLLQVNDYIIPEVFGLDGPWCPLIHGREEEGCQSDLTSITLACLLASNTFALLIR